VPEGTARVSVVARYLALLTEIFGAGVSDAVKAQNVGEQRKTPGVDLSSSGVDFLAFLPPKKLRLPVPTLKLDLL
jgi:hypothetical protein